MNTATRTVVRTSRWEPEEREGRHFTTHGISLSRRATWKTQARYNDTRSRWYHVFGVVLAVVVVFIMFLNAVSK